VFASYWLRELPRAYPTTREQAFPSSQPGLQSRNLQVAFPMHEGLKSAICALSWSAPSLIWHTPRHRDNYLWNSHIVPLEEF
jgi:hypothetical protein